MGKLVVDKIRASGLKVRKYGGSEQPDTPDEPDMVTIRFNKMDGTGVISEQMECGTPLTAPTVGTRNGYEFTGWVPEVPSAVPQTDTEFTAQWSPIEYTITYNMNGHGEVPSGALSSYTIESEEYMPHSPALVDGWTFNGWTPEGIPAGSTGDFTFTANWVEQVAPTGENTRVWWSDDENDYSDIPITGELTSYSLAVDGHAAKDAVKIEIGNTVTSIGSKAFYYCGSLTNVVIPDSVTSIGASAFYWCDGLTSVTIPNSVTSIGDSAFFCCIGLTNITIGDGVTSIGDDAFRDCDGLTSVTIPDSVTSIGDEAFSYCDSLTSVVIGNGVTSIGDRVFCVCYSLTNVVIPDSVTSIGASAFSNCSSLTSVTIPDSVKSIGYGAFYNCSSLTSVTIPDGVTNIGDSAFWSCSGLMGVEIPNSVTNIASYAFYGCSGLTSVTIPSSVASIGRYAFYGCSGLTSVTFLGKTLEQVQIIEDGNGNKYYSWGLDESVIHAEPEGPVVPPDPETVTISWNLNGGTDQNGNATIPDSVVEIGSAIPIPNAVRDGYTFSGWWSGGTRLEPGTTATVNATYTAEWNDETEDDTFDNPEFIEELNQIDQQYPIPTFSEETVQMVEQMNQDLIENPPFPDAYQQSNDAISNFNEDDEDIDLSYMRSDASPKDSYYWDNKGQI